MLAVWHDDDDDSSITVPTVGVAEEFLTFLRLFANAQVQLEFELTDCNVSVQHINLSACKILISPLKSKPQHYHLHHRHH